MKNFIIEIIIISMLCLMYKATSNVVHTRFIVDSYTKENTGFISLFNYSVILPEYNKTSYLIVQNGIFEYKKYHYCYFKVWEFNLNNKHVPIYNDGLATTLLCIYEVIYLLFIIQYVYILYVWIRYRQYETMSYIWFTSLATINGRNIDKYWEYIFAYNKIARINTYSAIDLEDGNGNAAKMNQQYKAIYKYFYKHVHDSKEDDKTFKEHTDNLDMLISAISYKILIVPNNNNINDMKNY
jgi:hypothetical protein